MIEPIAWRNGAVVLLDQRALPGEEIYLSLHSAEQVIEAIRDLVVRGARRRSAWRWSRAV